MFQIYHTQIILPVSTLIYTWMGGLTDPSLALKPLGLTCVLAIMTLSTGLAFEVCDVGGDGHSIIVNGETGECNIAITSIRDSAGV